MLNKVCDIVVVGATTLVGETLIEILAERGFPVGVLYLLDVNDSAGGRIQFEGKSVVVGDVADFDFSQVQLAFFTAGEKVAAEYAPKAAGAGCVVIDSSAEFRYDDDVPLVVPEVNPEQIAQYNQSNIIANPDCSVIQMMVALKPIFDLVGIKRVSVAIYQAVSEMGKAGIEELAGQTAALLNVKPIESKVYAKQIAFNVMPCLEGILENGYTDREMALVSAGKKILADDAFHVNSTTATVPVFFGNSMAIHVETVRSLAPDRARALLGSAAGVVVLNELEPEGCPTPALEAAGKDSVYVAGIRGNSSVVNSLDLWVVTDNIRKGAALNSIQIAEILIKRYV